MATRAENPAVVWGRTRLARQRSAFRQTETIPACEQQVLVAGLRELGVSQRAVARYCGVSEATVSRWIHGTLGMRPIYARALLAWNGMLPREEHR